MGVFKTADGRSLVGIGQQDGNEYSGFAGWRDCVIQLTASGATEDSVKYLNAIKDYAIAHNAKGESIMPPNLSIWISNNGVTTAVQADDIAVDGANVTICGIKWNGTAWDYTDAGKGGGGGGATSLNDLSDVKITNPAFGQTLVYHESPSPGFINERYDFSDLGGISQNALGAGITLLKAEGSGAVFDYYQCVESPTFGASVAQGFEQVITALKPVAKSSGKAGAKVPVANAVGIVSTFITIQDTKKRVPAAIFGDYVFFPKGRISSTKFLFSSADTDSDGIYDIIFAVDANASAVYVTVEYTACPAMS